MSFELESVIKIFMALVCGGLIGYEREYKNRPAGLRTHVLVCMGAALVMIVSQYMYNMGTGGNIDTTRLGAQVVSGIGFLGAGTIIRERFSVKGLTTAASLWTVGCVGIAVGSGYFLIAGVTTIVIFGSLTLLRKLEGVLRIKPEKAKVKITAIISEGVNDRIWAMLEDGGYKIKGAKFIKNPEKNQVSFSLDVSCADEKAWNAMSLKLYDSEEVIRADIEF